MKDNKPSIPRRYVIWIRKEAFQIRVCSHLPESSSERTKVLKCSLPWSPGSSQTSKRLPLGSDVDVVSSLPRSSMSFLSNRWRWILHYIFYLLFFTSTIVAPIGNCSWVHPSSSNVRLEALVRHWLVDHWCWYQSPSECWINNTSWCMRFGWDIDGEALQGPKWNCSL